LVGKSASGKTTVEKLLCDGYGYNRIISYTTRPQRSNEENGVDYHFTTEVEFQRLLDNGFFAEHSMYRGYNYGIGKDDCTSGKVVVSNPHGLRQFKEIFPSSVTSFYLKVSKWRRLARFVKRGDAILESFRRIVSDENVFKNAEEECDHVIECDGMQPCTIAELIHSKKGALS